MKVLLILSMVAALAAAPPASADSGGFVADAGAAGFTGNVLRDGYAVCSSLADGGDLMERITRRVLGREDRGEVFQGLAVKYLCPEQVG